MKPLSIRWKMMVWNTTAFAVVLFIFGILVYSLLHQTHYDQLDRALHARYREIMEDKQLPVSPEKRLPFWVRKFGKHGQIAGVVRHPDGRILAQTQQLQPFPPLEAPRRISSQPQFDSLTLPNQEQMRRLTSVVSTPAGDYTLMLLAELEHLNEELVLVRNILLVTIPVTLIVAGMLAYFLAYKALAPVEQLRQQTDEITADHLNRRLPVPHSADELGLLAQTINSMIQRLEHSFDEVRRFTADASHELRTPVAIIRSEAEMGNAAADDPAAARLRFESILEECNRLAAVTGQLLTLSREDAGIIQFRRSSLPVAPLIHDALESLRPRALAKNQVLSADIDEHAEVFTDADRLRQVLHNLLDNAIKYTPENGQIHVTFERDSSHAILIVRDNGPGIPPEHLSRVFDRFYRAHKNSDTGDGAGLGLSIVQSLMISLGGRVEVQSTLGTGTAFLLFLPLPAKAGGNPQ